MSTTVPPGEPPEGVPANQRYVRQGGLMRCCLGTIAESEELTKIGDILDCKYQKPGNQQMRVAIDGVWEWNHP
jgi:hypothetical protein